MTAVTRYERKVKDYEIVAGKTADQLRERVLELIRDGWETAGGIAVDSSEGGLLYQAMTREVTDASTTYVRHDFELKIDDDPRVNL